MVLSESFIEIAHGSHEESVNPHPLGSIVVAETLSDLHVGRVIAVVVIGHEEGVMGLAKSGNSY